MSHYGILLPGFWGGDTGRRVAEVGGTNAQVLALYLTSNPEANMIGLYQIDLPIAKVRIHTLSAKAIEKAFGAIAEAGFADFDLATRYVWVREMAKYRTGLHQLGALKPDDNRVKAAIKLYAAAKSNPFLAPFFDRYSVDLHLPLRRDGVDPSKGNVPPFEGSESVLGTPSKPVTEAVAVQEQRTENPDQDPREDRAPRPVEPVEKPVRKLAFTRFADQREKLLAAAHAYLDESPDATKSDVDHYLKVMAGKLLIADSSSAKVGAVTEAVLATRSKRRSA